MSSAGDAGSINRQMATHQVTTDGARVGDWIEARGIYGQAPRRGQIVELPGA